MGTFKELVDATKEAGLDIRLDNLGGSKRGKFLITSKRNQNISRLGSMAYHVKTLEEAQRAIEAESRLQGKPVTLGNRKKKTRERKAKMATITWHEKALDILPAEVLKRVSILNQAHGLTFDVYPDKIVIEGKHKSIVECFANVGDILSTDSWAMNEVAEKVAGVTFDNVMVKKREGGEEASPGKTRVTVQFG